MTGTVTAMRSDAPASRIDRHLRRLVAEIGPPPPGSPANRRATDYVLQVLSATGLKVRTQPFTCAYWKLKVDPSRMP